MPIYEFRCKTCGHEFEKLVASARNQSARCPTCSGPTSRKISVFSAQAASTSNASSAPAGMCGCGKRMGSCGMGGN